MNSAVSVLLQERQSIIGQLKQGKKEQLIKLQEIDNAIGWLKLLMQTQVEKASRYEIVQLPFVEGHGYSFFHLMIDNESGKKENWEEYQLPDGRQLELCMGDIIFVHKGY